MLNNFSFIVDGVLAACAHPDRLGDCSIALEELRNKGIGAIVSLDEDGLPLYLIADNGFHHLHLAVDDFTAPTLEQARQFVEFVHSQRNAGRAVAVHCGAGLGRTGTMLACYLVAEGHSADDAIAEIRRRRPGSIETSEQEDFIREFEQTLRHGTQHKQRHPARKRRHR